MKIGVICPSEIAFRRFMPALQKCSEISYAGVAIADEKEWFGDNYEETDPAIRKKVIEGERRKVDSFSELYGGKIYNSYTELIKDKDVEAIYIPLPPALHYKWAKTALENGKHVFVEKPSTIKLKDTEDLIHIAEEKGLALHENYMFAFHEQLKAIHDIIERDEIGKVRLYKIYFGFPKRAKNDFRYSKALGGGALLDCGGYTLKYASMLLGGSAKLLYAKSNYTDEFEVDLYGSGALSNENGDVVQIAFGMDNSYKCELEIWGSTGVLSTGRVLTAPAGFVPTCTIQKNNENRTEELPPDDTFLKSIRFFQQCISDETTRTQSYDNIRRQAGLVNEFMELASNDGRK